MLGNIPTGTPCFIDANIFYYQQHQLLTNDALTLALLEKIGITDLVTNDDDFDSVAGITVWKPR